MITRPQVSHGRLLVLSALFGLVWWQWGAPWLYPLRILVTLFHEFGHGFAGLLTGGSIDKITVEPSGSGLCFVSGGWRWLILPAGYLGSMSAGCAILLLACRSRYDRFVSMALGFCLIGATLLYVRTQVGLVYGIGSGIALASAGWWLREEANDLLLCFLGIATCLNALLDLRYLTSISGGYTDAMLFSREIFPLPPVVWALAWSAAALVALWLSLKVALQPERPLH